MFRTKRSGLVRRLWRSRLIPDKEGEDGNGKTSEGCRDDVFGNNPEKIPKTEFRPMTPSGSPGGGARAVRTRSPVESSALRVTVDQDVAAVCLTEQGSPRSVQDSEGRTVTCCLFSERDHSVHRAPDTAQGSVDPGSCHFAHRNPGARDGGPAEAQEAMPRTVLDQELKSATYSLLKRLKEKALDTLLEAVESRGGMPSDCVMISRTELRFGGHVTSPQLLVCKLYRWSDLQHSAQLKPLCECKSSGAPDSPTVCCNPYHYSRLCGPGKTTGQNTRARTHPHVHPRTHTHGLPVQCLFVRVRVTYRPAHCRCCVVPRSIHRHRPVARCDVPLRLKFLFRILFEAFF